MAMFEREPDPRSVTVTQARSLITRSAWKDDWDGFLRISYTYGRFTGFLEWFWPKSTID